MGTIRLRTKPKKPVRNTKIKETIEIDVGLSLQDVLDLVSLYGEDTSFEDIIIEYHEDTIDLRYQFVFYRKETDEEFRKRLDKYQKKLDKWNTWYEENKEEIEAERQKRREKAEKRKERDEKVKDLQIKIRKLQREKL